ARSPCWATCRRPRPLPGRLPHLPAPDSTPAWAPQDALPTPAHDGRQVDIVLSPHPDDETLSLGVWTADAAVRGDRVIVVCLTDGRTTGALATIARRLRRPVTRDEIAAARIRELHAATARLGVRPDDVYLAHLDRDDGPGGTRLTELEALAVIKAFAARFPDATFATMSWAAERHPDHLGAAFALQEAVARGIARHGVFAVSRLWWALPSPPVTIVLPLNAAVRHQVTAAANAYGLWNPADHRLAVGWTSVHQQFVDLLADPRDRVHGWAPLTAGEQPPVS
ncbi:MAG TPA: PIG-L family deacetylase, partial [Kineosporiaceae bacterium]